MSDSALNRRRFLRRAALTASTLGGTALVAPLTGCGDSPGQPSGNPPATPTNLVATGTSASRINLTWVDSATNEIAYEVQRRQGGGEFGQRATTGIDQTAFLDTDLTPQTTYEYRVRAFNADGASDFTPPATATTLALATGVPAPPTALNASDLTTSGVELNWQNSSTDELNLRVEVRANIATEFSQLALLPAGTTHHSVTGLVADTAYAFRVLASNDVGDSAPTDSVLVFTGVVAENLSAAPGATPGQIVLTWVDHAAGAVALRVERRLGVDPFASLGALSAGATTFTDTSLSPGANHAYRIAVAAGLALPAPDASIEVPQLPEAPVSLAAALSATSGQFARLSWQAGPGGAPSGYELERKAPPGNFAPIDLGADPSVAEFEDRTTAVLTNYDYRVRATNLAGVSAFSATARVSTRAVFTAASVVVSGQGTMGQVLTTVGKACLVRLSRAPRDFGSSCGGSVTFVWIIRESETKVDALVAHCTHACTVAPGLLYVESQGLLHCNSHGSEFSLSGAVTQGPAGSPLPAFQTELFPDRLEIFQ